MIVRNKSEIKGGHENRKTSLKKGRVFVFESFDKAYKFCEENNLSFDEIQAKHASFIVEIK